MGVVTTKSTFITNRDAIPSVISNPILAGAMVREAEGWVTATSGDSATSKYIFCSIPSNARLVGLKFQCAALGASSAMDIGAYKTTKDGGAVISSNFFAAAIDTHLALAQTDVLNQSTSNTIDLQEMPLWQNLGLASDPGGYIDIVGTVNVAIAATGKCGIKASYVQ